MTKILQVNQKGIAFIPILIGVFIVITGVAVVSEATGNHLSLSNPLISKESNSSSQGQVEVLPTSSSTSSNFDYEGAKAAGLTDEEIQAYLASKSPNGTVTIKDKTTGEIKKIPKSQLANYISTKEQSKSVKPSDKALRVSVYIFALCNEKQRNDLINKFSNGKNDLKQAINNVGLLLDSKPEMLILAEKIVAKNIAQKTTENTKEYSTTMYNNLKSTNMNTLNINNSSENLPVSSTDYTNISKTQYTSITQPILLTETKPKSGFIQKGSQRTDSLGNTYFYNDDGTTGITHTDSLGNIYYGDSIGRSSITTKDSFGNYHSTNNLGGSIDTQTDSLGNTTYFGNNGTLGTSHADSLGNIIYSDNNGNNTVCRTDSLGHVICN